MRVHAGTSGFAYPEWRDGFYPPDLPARQMLTFYAARLPAVEINSTFYRMPAEKTMAQWAAQVPETFRFTLKAPATITHRKKLLETGRETAQFFASIGHLGQHLGAVLFQLPPSFPCDLPLLNDFLQSLPKVRIAFEFRHPSWHRDKTFELLASFQSAYCISDREDHKDPAVVATAPFGYLRLRREGYDARDILIWKDRISSQNWEEAFVFFRHEQSGAGVKLATLLLDSTEGTFR